MNLMLPFILAQCSTLLLAVVMLWAFRPLLAKAGGYLQQHFEVYAWAYIKCLCLVTLAIGGTFKETWQSITVEQAAKFAVWDWMIHLTAPILSGVTVLSAFLDHSMQRADEAKAAKTGTAPPFPKP